MDLGFLLVDVEAARQDLPAFERFDERVFVDDGATSGVNNDDPLLHLAEFVGGDYVACMFLDTRSASVVNIVVTMRIIAYIER